MFQYCIRWHPFLVISVLMHNDNTIIAKKIHFTTSNIKNSVFLAKDTKRSEKDTTVDTQRLQLHHPEALRWCKLFYKRKSKRYSWYSRYQKLFTPKAWFAHSCQNVVFVRLIPISFLAEPWPVSTEGFQPTHALKRILAKAYCQVFSL